MLIWFRINVKEKYDLKIAHFDWKNSLLLHLTRNFFKPLLKAVNLVNMKHSTEEEMAFLASSFRVPRNYRQPIVRLTGQN